MGAECDWEASLFRPADKSGILELDRAEYGDMPNAGEAHFDWLCYRNPEGSPIIPVARQKGTGRVLGFLFCVPTRVCRDGEEQRALICLNVLVDRAYRRHRIYGTLIQLATEEALRTEYAFAYMFPNAKSLPGLIKGGCRLVSPISVVVRPLKVIELTRGLRHGPLVRWGVNLAWGVAGRTLYREAPSGKDRLLSHVVVEDSRFDETYDVFWEQVKTKYRFMIARDSAFLNWRFHEIPSRRYQALSARNGKEILGYVVLSQADVRGTETGLIADFLVQPGPRGQEAGASLLAEALKRFKRADLCLTGTLTLPHTEEYAILRRAGYMRTPERFSPQVFHLVARALAESVPWEELIRPDNWFISIADHDAV